MPEEMARIVGDDDQSSGGNGLGYFPPGSSPWSSAAESVSFSAGQSVLESEAKKLVSEAAAAAHKAGGAPKSIEPGLVQWSRDSKSTGKLDATATTYYSYALAIQHIDSHELQALIAREDSKFPLLIFDLRPRAEFLKSRIEGSQGFPVDAIEFQSFELLDLLKELDNVDELDESMLLDQVQLFTSARRIILYGEQSTRERSGRYKEGEINETLQPAYRSFLDVFAKEGWEGQAYFLRDGFKIFSTAYPECIDSKPTWIFNRMLASLGPSTRSILVQDEASTSGTVSSKWGESSAASSVDPDAEPIPSAGKSSHRSSHHSSSSKLKSIKSKSKKDDWSEIVDPEEQRRVQNRIAQRKFRNKAKEAKERLDREIENQIYAKLSNQPPNLEELGVAEELSALPWGSFSLKHEISKGRETESSRRDESHSGVHQQASIVYEYRGMYYKDKRPYYHKRADPAYPDYGIGVRSEPGLFAIPESRTEHWSMIDKTNTSPTTLEDFFYYDDETNTSEFQLRPTASNFYPESSQPTAPDTVHSQKNVGDLNDEKSTPSLITDSSDVIRVATKVKDGLALNEGPQETLSSATGYQLLDDPLTSPNPSGQSPHFSPANNDKVVCRKEVDNSLTNDEFNFSEIAPLNISDLQNHESKTHEDKIGKPYSKDTPSVFSHMGSPSIIASSAITDHTLNSSKNTFERSRLLVNPEESLGTIRIPGTPEQHPPMPDYSYSGDSDEIHESALDALDSDKSSDREDSRLEDREKSTLINKHLFQPVAPKPNQSSHESLITNMLMQREKDVEFVESEKTTESQIAAIKDTKSQSRSSSPGTTRRNLIATELTTELRQSLLLERRQKGEPAATIRKFTSSPAADLDPRFYVQLDDDWKDFIQSDIQSLQNAWKKEIRGRIYQKDQLTLPLEYEQESKYEKEEEEDLNEITLKQFTVDDIILPDEFLDALEKNNLDLVDRSIEFIDGDEDTGVTQWWEARRERMDAALLSTFHDPYMLKGNFSPLFRGWISIAKDSPRIARRLQWTCRCGHKSFDDFQELRKGGVQDFADDLLKSGYITHAQVTNQATVNTSRLAMVSNNLFIAAQRKMSRLSSNLLPVFHTSPVSAYPKIPCLPAQQCRWLHMCLKKRPYATKLEPLHVCRDGDQRDFTDATFFNTLRKAYYSQRSWTEKMLFKLRKIEFVEFELCPDELVDHIIPNKLPPTIDEYDFHPPPPPKKLPPIGEAHLMHLFTSCAGPPLATSLYLRQIPKRKSQALCFQPEKIEGNIGWGLHFVESLNGSLAVTVMFAVSLVLGLIFAVCWSIWKKDVQGAFGVAAYLTSVMTLAVMTWQMWSI